MKIAKILEIKLTTVFLMVYVVQKLKGFFFANKIFTIGGIDPKFGILAFSAIFTFHKCPKIKFIWTSPLLAIVF